MGLDVSLWTGGIADCHAAGLLTSVLQGVQPAVQISRRIVSVKVINAEYAACLFDFIRWIEFHSGSAPLCLRFPVS